MKKSIDPVKAKDLQTAIKILQAAANGHIQNFEEEVKLDIDQIIEFSKRIGSKLQTVVQPYEDQIKQSVAEKLCCADAAVHEKPWTYISAAAGVGLLCGFLFAKKPH